MDAYRLVHRFRSERLSVKILNRDFVFEPGSLTLSLKSQETYKQSESLLDSIFCNDLR